MTKHLSKSDLILMLDIIHSSLKCKSEQEFKCLINSTKTLINFEYVRSLFGDSNKYKTHKMGALKMITEFPMEWEIRYNEKDYFLYDNIALTAYNKAGLIFWHDYVELKKASDSRNQKSREIMEEAGSIGLKQGWLYSFKGQRSSERAILSIAGDQCDNSERSREILDYLAPHLCQAIRRIIIDRNKPSTNLTPRECEILSWTATGKTAWEVSLILNISRRTVEFHIGNILNKLDAVNSQQAIAIGISNGLISY